MLSSPGSLTLSEGAGAAGVCNATAVRLSFGDFAAWTDGVRTARGEERPQSTAGEASELPDVLRGEEKVLAPVKFL